jgi:hypothetical protein
MRHTIEQARIQKKSAAHQRDHKASACEETTWTSWHSTTTT